MAGAVWFQSQEPGTSSRSPMQVRDLKALGCPRLLSKPTSMELDGYQSSQDTATCPYGIPVHSKRGPSQSAKQQPLLTAFTNPPSASQPQPAGHPPVSSGVLGYELLPRYLHVQPAVVLGCETILKNTNDTITFPLKVSEGTETW